MHADSKRRGWYPEYSGSPARYCGIEYRNVAGKGRVSPKNLKVGGFDNLSPKDKTASVRFVSLNARFQRYPAIKTDWMKIRNALQIIIFDQTGSLYSGDPTPIVSSRFGIFKS